MSGNVWEWVADLYSETYYASSPKLDPPGPSSGQYRVLRGGSWGNMSGGGVRGAIRLGGLPDGEFNYSGFRCARSL